MPCYPGLVTTVLFKARVQGGRLKLDEPVDLPDGTVVDLVAADTDDDLDEADRLRLHQALQRSAEQFASGSGIPALEALARLRARDAD